MKDWKKWAMRAGFGVAFVGIVLAVFWMDLFSVVWQRVVYAIKADKASAERFDTALKSLAEEKRQALAGEVG